MLHAIVNYLAYFGTTLLLLIVAGIVYVRFTPGDELALIRQGNVAAAAALAGAMVGYAVVVYSAAAHGSTWLEMIVWSVISLIVQIIAVELVTHVVHDKWKDEIARGDVAHGVALGAFALSVGLLNAGCLTP